MDDKGFFGDLFDFNGDGTLDSFERAADFTAFMRAIEAVENDSSSSDDDNEEGENAQE